MGTGGHVRPPVEESSAERRADGLACFCGRNLVAVRAACGTVFIVGRLHIDRLGFFLLRASSQCEGECTKGSEFQFHVLQSFISQPNFPNQPGRLYVTRLITVWQPKRLCPDPVPRISVTRHVCTALRSHPGLPIRSGFAILCLKDQPVRRATCPMPPRSPRKGRFRSR